MLQKFDNYAIRDEFLVAVDIWSIVKFLKKQIYGSRYTIDNDYYFLDFRMRRVKFLVNDKLVLTLFNFAEYEAVQVDDSGNVMHDSCYQRCVAMNGLYEGISNGYYDPQKITGKTIGLFVNENITKMSMGSFMYRHPYTKSGVDNWNSCSS
jgi:hypothetical protein